MMKNEITGLHYPDEVPAGANSCWELFYACKQHSAMPQQHQQGMVTAIRNRWFKLYWVAYASLTNWLHDGGTLTGWGEAQARRYMKADLMERMTDDA